MGLIYEVYHGCIRHWLYQGDGVDLQGRVMGAPDWIGAIESICRGMPWDAPHWLVRGDGIESWGYVTLAESGRWNCFMGTCNTGWSGAIGLIYGGVRHWLNRVMGLIQGGLPWGPTTLAGSGWWDRFMGVCRGACNTGWIGAMGLIYGIHHGAHNWIGEMGLIWGGTPLECDTGWDTSWGRDWIKEMGLICGDTTWGCDTGWMWMMRLIYGGIPRGRTTGSGRWNWFVEVNHGGAWHWLDLGEGIDLCGRVMRARDTGWIGLWKWFMGGVSNDKVLYGCWIWITIPCVLCLALR